MKSVAELVVAVAAAEVVAEASLDTVLPAAGIAVEVVLVAEAHRLVAAGTVAEQFAAVAKEAVR